MSVKLSKSNINSLIINILIILLILLVGATIYNLRTKNTKAKVNTLEKTVLKEAIENDIKTLDSLETDNESIDNALQKAKSALIQLRDSVDQLKNIDRQTIHAIYKRLSVLEITHQKLIHKPNIIKSDEKYLDESLDSLPVDNQLLPEEKDLKSQPLEEEKSKATGTNLKIGSVRTIAMKERYTGNLKSTNYAQKTVAFRTNFTLQNNKTVKAGLKKTYLVLRDDHRKILSPKGTFIDINGHTLQYTDKTEVDFKNKDVDIVLLSSISPVKLTKGTYTLEVYIENKKLGQTSLELK